MPFSRFVETGRVALVAEGPFKGRLVSIVDVIDQTRVLVDGPVKGSAVPRCQLRLKDIHLTKFKIQIPFTARRRMVRKAWITANISDKWAKSVWAKKIEAKEKRASLTDFDRFKLRRARSRRNSIRTLAFYRIKKKSSRDGSLYGKKKMGKGVTKPKVKLSA